MGKDNGLLSPYNLLQLYIDMFEQQMKQLEFDEYGSESKDNDQAILGSELYEKQEAIISEAWDALATAQQAIKELQANT